MMQFGSSRSPSGPCKWRKTAPLMRGGHKLELPSCSSTPTFRSSTSMRAVSHNSFQALRRGFVFTFSSSPRRSFLVWSPSPPPRLYPLSCHERGSKPKIPLYTSVVSEPRFKTGSPAAQSQQCLDLTQEGEGEELPAMEVQTAFSVDADLKPPPAAASVEVMDLEELPEQWRRSRLAWLCKELPAHKAATVIRILNGQRKWITQGDATYVVVHCMRIRENETAFRVYKWMLQQHWFQFDFALATKLADYLGKDRKFAKCRELFDQIINQGHVPSESTFHILIVAYLSAPVQGCLEEACSIYNRMIQLGEYRPRLSLHNSLFRAITGKPGVTSKYYLNQAEFIFQNIVTSQLEIHKDIFAGLVWLHSYQDTVDRERIASLRLEMQQLGIEEESDVLVSILRVCAKEGDVEEAERTWCKLLESRCMIPSQAFTCRMEVYAKASEPVKSYEIFKEMKELVKTPSVVSYHKIIEIMSRAKEVDIVEALMDEFILSGLKPIMPSYIDMMVMYFKMDMHDKVESAFSQCLSKCRPNRSVYCIYLDSLVTVGNLDKAEVLFNEMQVNGAIGINSRSCNLILGAYLRAEEHMKAEKIYDMMCQKKYDIETSLMEKMEEILSMKRNVVKKPISLKLDKEQREILMGLLLGGVKIVSDDGKNRAIVFEFKEKSEIHSVLKVHIHGMYYEWLKSTDRLNDGSDEIPHQFATVMHSCFDFYADQFWPKGRPAIPKLIHRWLSARVLAYWYTYGGLRTSSGDIVLKLKSGSRQDVERVVKIFKAKSLNCKVKMKGKVYWIGFQGSDAVWFWKLVEPYILEDLRDFLKVDGNILTYERKEDRHIQYDSEFNVDGNISDYSGDDNGS